MFFFFFQAEDGIRDLTVTGVQTCALPIWSHSAVAIGREDGTVLGRAEGPGAAMRPGGAAASVVVLADIARRAATQAVVSLPVDRAVVGAAGAGRAQGQQELAAARGAGGNREGGGGAAGPPGARATAVPGGPGLTIH